MPLKSKTVLWPVLLATGFLVAASVSADTGAPFKDTPSGPKALKGDVIPPFGYVGDDGHYIPAPQTLPPGVVLGAHRKAETDAPGPSLDVATRAAQRAIKVCLAQGYRIGVAVIDSAGQARVLLNADGTDGSHGFVAMRKAEAARVFNLPSSQVNRLVQSDPSALSRLTPNMLADGGAVPIVSGGVVVGAIGASGAAGKIIGAQDELCATAGRDYILRHPGKM